MSSSIPYVPPTPAPFKSPYAVKCWTCGLQDLTREQYDTQMADADALWACPKCGRPSEFDDARYESFDEDRFELWQETNEEAVEIAAKIASQFPKVHHHAAGWKGKDESTAFTSMEDFLARTIPYEEQTDRWCKMEHRHCHCGSTLMVVVSITDLPGFIRVGGL